MSLTRRAFLATWWSLPLGLADGLRVGLDTVAHNSLFAESFHLRALASASVVVLFHAAVFFLLALVGSTVWVAMARGSMLVLTRWVISATFWAACSGEADGADANQGVRVASEASISKPTFTWTSPMPSTGSPRSSI